MPLGLVIAFRRKSHFIPFSKTQLNMNYSVGIYAIAFHVPSPQPLPPKSVSAANDSASGVELILQPIRRCRQSIQSHRFVHEMGLINVKTLVKRRLYIPIRIEIEQW